jgi:hypothetical protein
MILVIFFYNVKKNNIGSIDLKIKSSFFKKYFLTFLS